MYKQMTVRPGVLAEHMGYPNPKKEEATRNLGAAWSQVTAFVAAMDASLGKWLMDKHGLGLTEYQTLLHLNSAPDRELRLNELAQRVGLNQSSVTRLVERLERKELAFRDTCPDDARGIFAVITDRGADIVDKVRESFDAKVRELLQGAAKRDPQLDRHALRRALTAIGEQIG